jgi:hypothetical protein
MFYLNSYEGVGGWNANFLNNLSLQPRDTKHLKQQNKHDIQKIDESSLEIFENIRIL